jgi:hypothetical protein
VLLSVLGGLHDRVVRASPRGPEVTVAIELYVVGPRAAGVNAPIASAKTREVIALVREWASARAMVTTARAADVKPWATDLRLDTAGLLEPTKGMRHARDGARHALYAACKLGILPDPLSMRPPRSDAATGIRVEL